MEAKLTYLAAPYSSQWLRLMADRLQRINRFAAKLATEGELIYSPISHSAALATEGGLPAGYDYWEQLDRTMLGYCRKIIVLRIEGWDKSIGVAAEIKYATELGLEIEYRDE